MALKVVTVRSERAFASFKEEVNKLTTLSGKVHVITIYDYEIIEKEWTVKILMKRGDMDVAGIIQDVHQSGVCVPIAIERVGGSVPESVPDSVELWSCGGRYRYR